MQTAELKKDDKTIIPKCSVAVDFISRFVGLMGKTTLQEDEAVCFPKCNSIHTFFMRISIDVLFVNQAGTVVEVLQSLKPWKMLLPRTKARHVIEMKSSLARNLNISVGDKLRLSGVFG